MTTINELCAATFLPPPSSSSPFSLSSSASSPSLHPRRRPTHLSAALLPLPPLPTSFSFPSPHLLAELTADYQSIAPTFEPRLDVGALLSLVSKTLSSLPPLTHPPTHPPTQVIFSFVTFLFWGRVATAITDREKREKLEKVQKEMQVKRLTGKLGAFSHPPTHPPTRRLQHLIQILLL